MNAFFLILILFSGESINNILLYYNINTAKEINDCTYYYNGKRLIICELKDNESLNYNLFRYPFSIPILNIFGSYYTDFNNKRYVLFSSFF